jgi:hypothetical protein
MIIAYVKQYILISTNINFVWKVEELQWKWKESTYILSIYIYHFRNYLQIEIGQKAD